MQLQKQYRLAQLPLRPRGPYSDNFRNITISTNHFQVELSTFERIFIFSVRYTPLIPYDNSLLRRKLLDQCREGIRQVITNPVMSGNNIYSITQPAKTEFQLIVGEYTISIKQVKVLEVKQNPKLLLSFLNNGLRNIMNKLNYSEIGKSGKYFNVKDKKQIDGLMMFSGYKSNFVLLENGFYLRVDSAKKIVRNETVLNAIDQMNRFHQDKDKDQKRSIMQNQLFGKIVMTNYGKTCYHRIEQVVFDGNIDNTFLEDEKMSIRQYYQTKYQITIKNAKQPLLRVESKRKNCAFKILLVPELCLMTGIPDDFDQFRRKKISEQTIKDASEKQREILKLMGELKDTQQFSALRQMGIKVSRKLLTITGKIIPMPRITLGQQHSIEQGKQAFFNLYNKPIYSSKHSIKCGVIYFSGVDTRPLIDTFQSTFRNLHVKLQIIKLNAGQIDNRKALAMLENMVKKAADKQGCNICLIIIPNNLKTQYKKIKTMALLDNKMICQITTEGTLRKKNIQSIATKILLQIIAKRGNTLWVPTTKNSLPNIMISAFQTAKMSTNKHALSLCATLNSTYSSIFSKSMTYEQTDAKFNTMGNLLMLALGVYVTRNKEPPVEIFIFHRSTSGDQINLFQEHFINHLKRKMTDVYSDKSPLLTLIMVNVKTSERFFTQGEQVRNVPAGTLVASTVVSNYYDFYVVSQGSNRGSSVPNHYKVIYTDSKIEEGVLQQLIFSQCFNYVNWTGSIKVPGILQYADRCAKFNAEVLENREICEDLQNKLYFV